MKCIDFAFAKKKYITHFGRYSFALNFQYFIFKVDIKFNQKNKQTKLTYLFKQNFDIILNVRTHGHICPIILAQQMETFIFDYELSIMNP